MSKVIPIFILVLAALMALLTGVAKAAPAVDLKTMLASPVDLTVYSGDRTLVIGHAHYTIKEADGTVEIIVDTRYLNTESDWERVMLDYQPANPLPVVTSFQANYLASGGAPQLVEKADFKSGEASCRWSNEVEDSAYTDTLEFEPDTYVGAASVVPLEYALKKGDSSVRFHVFDCAPKPTIFTIDAKLQDGVARWSYYPGELAKMGLTPDLGWLNLVARPFIPNISVWFDPNHEYQYVGVTKDRFYRGRQIILVRTNPDHVRAESAQQAAPSSVSAERSKVRN